MRTIASVEDGASQVPGQKVRRAGGRVPNDDGIHPHGFDGLGRVDERLPFGSARSSGRKFDRCQPLIASQPRKTVARSGAVLKEQVGHGSAAQEIEFVFAPLGRGMQCLRHVQNKRQFVLRKRLQAQYDDDSNW